MPHERTDGADWYSEIECEETPDEPESREVHDEVEKDATEEAEDFDRQEEIEWIANEAAKEFDELRSKIKEIEDLAEVAAKEFDDLQREKDMEAKESFEDDLENDLDEVRDELHDEYVNDLSHQLEGVSRKDSEVEEGSDDGVTSEATEASESYEDVGTGMVYAMETRSESEGETQSEVECEKEELENTETHEPADDEVESLDDGFRNKISRQEAPEIEHGETSSSNPVEEIENQGVQQIESNETPELPEPESSKIEPQHDDQSELRHEDTKESRIEDDVDSVEEFDVDLGAKAAQEVEKSSEDSNEVIEPEIDSDMSELELSEFIEQEESSHEQEAFESELDDDIPEEFISRVEELVERLEESESESEERVIVEALTGERVVDRTLKPRSFFGEDEETSEEEDIRRRFRELFSELSEEERERLKEIIRSRLKSEEDLEELIARHPSVKLSSDYKQKLKDARSFVRGMKKGPAPKLVRELWALEVEREWTKVVGESIRRSFERFLMERLNAKSKKTKSKRKLVDSQGGPVQTCNYPKIGDEQIDSLRKLEVIVEQKFPGLKENKSYTKWMTQAKKYFKKSNPQKLHSHPTIFRMINNVLQNQIRVKSIRKRLGKFQDADTIKQKLVDLEMDESIDSWPTADKQWKHLELYYQILELLEKGMLQCDVDRKLKLGSTRTKAIIDGVTPWPIRIVVNPHSIRSKIQTEHSPIRLYESLENIGVISQQQLNVKLKEYPGLTTLSNFKSLKSDAILYFTLKENFKGRQNIRNSELLTISDRIGIAPTKARRWTLEANRPQLLVYIEQAIKNKIKANKLRTSLFANSFDHLSTLRRNLYIEPYLNQWKNIEDMTKYTKAYFRFLDLFETGYPLNIIASLLEVHETAILSWTKGILPRGLQILKEIPTNPPRNGWKWLPLRVEENVYYDYIEVPIKNIDFSSILEVCKQLKLPFQEFMYILGMILADGYIQPTSKTSYSLRILLSQKYEWSKKILEDVSNSFSMLSPSRISYLERELDSICELCIDSPFFVWMREVIFNLGPNDKKTYSTLKADWIHRIPQDFQIPFLQGIADGDGYASLISQRVGIGSLANKRHIKKILESFNIESLLQKKGIEIVHHASIRNLHNLPLFKNATSRLENLSELCEMIDARPKRKRVTSFEISEISRLRQKGLTYGEISLQLWREHKISRSIATIGRIARKYKTNS
ncbi:MAG: hypothetical protein AM325_000220 [Candidatus Thorarchaeota archaeon SMTZ1-45]|nr:MAG: hypothetical protein AM325_00225 [Candidatus Thorarchaeota archaeon SMTZ1-45]